MERLTHVSLFSGIGGLDLAAEAAGFETVCQCEWADYPYSVLERHWPDVPKFRDITTFTKEAFFEKTGLETVTIISGGFPCQDYSVARTLSSARGIEGKKGVLWWDIERFLYLKKPRLVLLENVDRILKSPAKQRGRDFAIILSCLASLGYSAEWQVINSAEYGFPQRRKRIYIFAERTQDWKLGHRLYDGVIPEAFPIQHQAVVDEVQIPVDPVDASANFNRGRKLSPFRNRGVLVGNTVLTCDVVERYSGERRTLGDVLVPESQVPAQFYIPDDQLPKWEYLKGSKREPRVAANGHEYTYSEGAMAFPDATDRPSRTILTGEGGSGPSRFKHVIQTSDGRLRRLVPDELDQLQGFPKGWTDTGMTDGNRAFCMGNALVVGIPHRIGEVIAHSLT